MSITRSIVVVVLATAGVLLTDYLGKILSGKHARFRTRRSRVGIAIGVAVTIIAVGTIALQVQPDPAPTSASTAPAHQSVQGRRHEPDKTSSSTSDPNAAFCPRASEFPVGRTGPYGLRATAPNGLTTQTLVGNVNCGDTQYTNQVGAYYDQVVKVELGYGVYGSAARPEVQLRFDVEQAADVSVVSGVLTTDGQPLVSRTAIYLGRADSRLQYIPNSMYWRHNVAQPATPSRYRTDRLNNAEFGKDYLLDRVEPGRDGEATVTALFRVIDPGIAIRVEIQRTPTSYWVAKSQVAPDENLRARIVVQNLGNEALRQVLVRLALPEGIDFDEASVMIGVVPASPKRRDDPALLTTGTSVGDLTPGQTATVEFRIHVAVNVPLGTKLSILGVTKPLGRSEYPSTAELLTT